MVLLWKSIYTQSTSKLTGGQYYDQTYTADGLEFLEHLGENINEKMIFETADVMAESGLRDKGYEYLVIDDCWSLRERDENGHLVPDPENFRMV
mgnify:FL=1